ncbi:MAG TPA: inositol monophosphatase family protein [Actinoplanes sp.]|nr:inositol monophosphatase family protein [Actinoplanes sp.]
MTQMIDEVGALIREVASEVVLPRFQCLTADEVHEKAPGDVVTIADQEAERLLTAGLARLLPGSVVVGEEAVAADPEVLRRLDGNGAVWLVDPVDGTANFAAGRAPFAVMVALIRDGTPVAGWILDVLGDRLAVAEAGSGAFVDGVRVRTRTDAPPAAQLRGSVASWYLPDELRAEVAQRGTRLGAMLPGKHCAGCEYPAVVDDSQQFTCFWRVLPWDHVPGALFVTEAGGLVQHLDGTPYRPATQRRGLLVAANADIWHTVRATLLP